MRTGEDTVVNQELARRGYQAYRAQDVVLVHRSPCRTPWRLLRHHFVRGRGLGRIRRERDGVGRRDLLSIFGFRLVWQQTAWRIMRTTRNVRRWGGETLGSEYRRAFPLVVAGVLAAAAGSVYEVLRPHSREANRGEDDRRGLRTIGSRKTAGGYQNDRPSGLENEAILPGRRIVAFYGHPVAASMGVLGNPDREAMLAGLRHQAAQYAAADPSRPVMPALELVAIIAHRNPGSDAAYRTRAASDLLDTWAAFAAREDALLILDVQPGRSPCAEEIAALRPWLRLSHVHLALDPEWAMGEDGVPGAGEGCLTASQIQAAQEFLADLVTTEGLPPKLLIVHQFKQSMIVDKASLRPVPGVQLVIDVDGHGDPRIKSEIYQALLHGQRVGFAGIKLFYRQDEPMLTPEQVLTLTPPPDLVVYQ
jgi:hypothetical protein